MRFITIKPKRLSKQKDLLEHFNSGQFARKDYKYLFHVKMRRGPMRVFLRTPSVAQVWYSTKLLMFGPVRHGMPYDNHKHPVQMEVYNIEDVAKRYYTPAQVDQFKKEAEEAHIAQITAANRAHIKKAGNRKARRAIMKKEQRSQRKK